MKFLIAYNNDGSDNACVLFKYCGEEMEICMADRSIENIVLNPPSLTNAHLLQNITSCQVCFIANHGNAKSIAGNNGDILSVSTDNTAFSGKLLYAISCTCAQELKDSLIADGLRSFWGYDKELSFWIGYPQYGQCYMAGIKSLMDGKTLKEAKEEMLDQYNNSILELESKYPDNPVLAALLVDNREALVVFGEDNLKLSDLE